MDETAAPRIVTGTVSQGRVRSGEEALAKSVGELLSKDGFTVVRHVVVRGEAEFLTALVQNVSNENVADAIILFGGTGFGPKDAVCESLEPFFEKKIEGFGEAYRRFLRTDFGHESMLARATAGVFNQCVVFALSGRHEDVKTAVDVLIRPVLRSAVDLATGRATSMRR
jgi:molybdenum cofactor biosynthesis protein B